MAVEDLPEPKGFYADPVATLKAVAYLLRCSVPEVPERAAALHSEVEASRRRRAEALDALAKMDAALMIAPATPDDLARATLAGKES